MHPYQVITLINNSVMDRDYLSSILEVKWYLNNLLFTSYSDIFIYKRVGKGKYKRIGALNRYDYSYVIFLNKKTDSYVLKKN